MEKTDIEFIMRKALFKNIRSLLELDMDREYRLIDLGCGRGQLLGTLVDSMNTSAHLVGMDQSVDSILDAREKYPDLKFIHEKFTDKPGFEDNCFDIVVSIDTLECISGKTAFINEVHRILKPGGKVVIAHWDWDTQVYNSVINQ